LSDSTRRRVALAKPMNGFVNDAPPSFADAAADLLASGWRLSFRATGRSMQPAIGEGERITVERISADDVRMGDIVLYRTKQSVIAHRVEKIERDADRVTVLLLRGDASEQCDDPVLPAQVIGRVVAVDREGRQVSLVSQRAKLRQRFRAYVSKIKGVFRLLSPGHAA
jgi:signal peptidase I